VTRPERNLVEKDSIGSRHGRCLGRSDAGHLSVGISVTQGGWNSETGDARPAAVGAGRSD